MGLSKVSIWRNGLFQISDLVVKLKINIFVWLLVDAAGSRAELLVGTSVGGDSTLLLQRAGATARPSPRKNDNATNCLCCKRVEKKRKHTCEEAFCMSLFNSPLSGDLPLKYVFSFSFCVKAEVRSLSIGSL